MATIRTSIMVNDMMSQQFRAMNMAMTTVIDSFQTLHDTTSKAVDVSALNAAQRELQQVESNFNQIEQEIQQAEQAQNEFNNQIRNGQSAASQLASKFVGIVATVGSLFAVGSVFKSGFDRLIGIDTAVAKLEALGHSAHTVEVIMDNALNSVSGTAFRLEEAVNTAASAVAAGVKPGQELERYLSLTADAAAIAGANMNEMGSIFNKITTSGMIQAEEMNQLLDRGIPIVQMLADTMGVAAEEVRSLASDGQISADIFLSAIENGFGGAAQSMGIASFQATLDNIGAAIGRIGAAFLNGANDGQGFFDQVKPLMVDLLNTLRGLEDHAKRIGAVFGSVFGFIYDNASIVANFITDNWSIIGPIIMGIVGALIVFVSYLALVKTWTMLVVAAQWAWNAVLAANPIMWVIIALVILISLFYAAIAAINHFAGTSISATGIVAGAFAVLGAFIYNMIGYIWNTLASFVEFFVNVWRHPMYTVKRYFYNLASNFIDSAVAMASAWDGFATNFVNAIISAVNGAIRAWNWFIDLLPADVASAIGLSKGSGISLRTSIASDLRGIKSSLSNWVGEAPADYWEAPRMEPIALGDAWSAGYQWGANLFSGFDLDRFEPDLDIKEALASQDALKDAIEKGNGAGRDTARNTKKLADNVDMATEDLKYLRDLAERDAVNRYVTGEIHVDARSENYINNELDIDGVIDRWAEKAEEASEMLAEGGVEEFV